jgi:aspartyl-tRNA(Asn)/glutamyl-tRNA(Gln) amidotransferase subunit C
MSVTLDDVRHIAVLARVALTQDRAVELVGELNTILEQMDVLAKVDTNGVEAVAGIGASLPLRPDAGPPLPLSRSPETFAPRMRDGFFLVPRLSTHDDGESSA